MSHWKTILAYDGTPFNGWQVQPGLPTVQGTLASAIHHITGETVLPQGSGRTDTGVHALGQVATFTLTVPIPAANLHRALNRALPSSIRVLSVEAVPPEFHARHSARRKTYEYRILPCGKTGGIICSPMLAPFVWACRLDLDLNALQQSAAHILGTHDFTSFAAVDPDLTTRNNENNAGNESNQSTDADAFDAEYFANLDTEIVTEAESEAQAERPTANHPPQPTQPPIISTSAAPLPASTDPEKSASLPPSSPNSTTAPTGAIRTIHDSAWRQQDDLFLYRVTGSGFLHHMVRNLVGTFVQAAAGRISPDAIPTILAARNRSAAGPTAPARGLFLVEVAY